MRTLCGRRGVALALLACTAVLAACGRGAGLAGSAPTPTVDTKTPPPDHSPGTPWPSPTGPQPTAIPEVLTFWSVPVSIATAAHPVVWYYADPPHTDTLVAYDWSGARRGTLHVSDSGQSVISPSPDGTRLVVRGTAQIEGAAMTGRSAGLDTTWARDDEHVCDWRALDGQPVDGRPQSAVLPAALWLGDASGGDHRVLAYGEWGAHGGPATLACSVPDDRALVAVSFTASMNDIRLIRLSTGARIAAAITSSVDGGIVASRDGAYVALGDAGGSWSGRGFAVLDTVTGARLAHIDGSALLAFSDDDTRALVVAWQNNSNQTGRYSLIDWRTGHVFWSAVQMPGTLLLRPHSGDFLLGNAHWVMRPDNSSRYPIDEPVIVHADGSVTTVAASLGTLE